MAIIDRFNTKNEKEIANAFLTVVGGNFLQESHTTAYSTYDRLWLDLNGKEHFVECRFRRTYSWDDLRKFGGVRVNKCKLGNEFLFVVRDKNLEIRVADINLKRLKQLLNGPAFPKMADQGGRLQDGLDVPYEWFEVLDVCGGERWRN